MIPTISHVNDKLDTLILITLILSNGLGGWYPAKM